MKIQPLFGRIIVQAVDEEPEMGLIKIPFTKRRDRGIIVNCGDSQIFKNGDLIIYDLRAARILKIDLKEYISIEEKDVLAVLIGE